MINDRKKSRLQNQKKNKIKHQEDRKTECKNRNTTKKEYVSHVHDTKIVTSQPVVFFFQTHKEFERKKDSKDK